MTDKDWFDDYLDHKLSGCENDEETTDNSIWFHWIIGLLVTIFILSKLL